MPSLGSVERAPNASLGTDLPTDLDEVKGIPDSTLHLSSLARLKRARTDIIWERA